jgi:hypothetical protein
MAWLRGVVNEAEMDDVTLVVLTHHVPLLELGDPQHATSHINSAFASDLREFILINTDVISHWFYGHNHYSEQVTIGKTVILSNQVGYKGNDGDAQYNPDLAILLPIL